jgi:hypothetical protein
MGCTMQFVSDGGCGEEVCEGSRACTRECDRAFDRSRVLRGRGRVARSTSLRRLFPSKTRADSVESASNRPPALFHGTRLAQLGGQMLLGH